MKMVEGAWKRAISKSSRTCTPDEQVVTRGGYVGWLRDTWWLHVVVLTIFSESPLHLEASVDEVSEKKEVPHSVATALAKSVLPVPGGPNMSTPFQGRRMPLK